MICWDQSAAWAARTLLLTGIYNELTCFYLHLRNIAFNGSDTYLVCWTMHMIKLQKKEEVRDVAVGARTAEEYSNELQLQRTLLTEVLEELYLLLEDYAPAWYTEFHHERAKAVLASMRKSENPFGNGDLFESKGTALSS
jgi:hypothetical protein